LRDTAAKQSILAGAWLVVDAAVVPDSPATQKPPSGAVFPYTQLPLQVLSGAAEEASAIAKIGTKTRLLQGATATEQALRTAMEAASPAVWHFAGHGSVNEKADGDVAAARFWEGSAAPSGFDHLGLFFPNFGHKQDATKADDWLSAAEIAHLPLQETLLAVFSSCHGGRGLAASGEGRFDLARAAHVAGVRDVLVAAGPVWDKAALQFMQDFYQQIAAGVDPAAAAWKAQGNLWQAARKVSLSESIRHAGPYRLVRHR
jgi:CHAT domain-containing protein